MATIQATLRKKKNKAGLYPISIRVTQNRKSTYFYFGQYIDEKSWDFKKNLVKKTHPNAVRLNNLISSKLAEINRSLLELESDNKVKSGVYNIKTKVKNRYKSHSFYNYAEEYFVDLEKNQKFSRINSERPILNRINGYPAAKNLTFENITPLFLRGLISHLRSQNSIGERTIANSLIFIRTLYNRAVNENLIKRDGYPFGNGDGKIKIKIPKSIKIGLTINELQLIEEIDLNNRPKYNHARNVFLFSFYLAGMRISDVLKMKWENVQDERIYYVMNKNQKNLSLKIHPKLYNILNQYAPNKNTPSDFIFPELKSVDEKNPKLLLHATKAANKSINRYLKKIAQEVKISKKLTMHIARHSFGNISGHRIPLQVLQKLYNHSDIKTTIDYQQNFMNKDLDDALDNVIGF